MGQGKQSKEGQALRRQRIIDYIRKNGPVKGSEICRDLDMFKTSLSDDIRAIKTGGIQIESPKKGVYILKEQPEEKKTIYSKIDRKSVRRWMILSALFSGDKSLEEIKEYLEDAEIPCAASVLYSDLTELRKAGLVTRIADGRERLYHSDSLYETDYREVSQYAKRRQKQNARIDISALKTMDLKIKHCFPDFDEETGSFSVKRSGKSNILTEDQFHMLQKFEQYPYTERALRIFFKTNAGFETSRVVQVGIIVYVVETARIYLIGKSFWKDNSGVERAQYSIIPMNQITSAEEDKAVNVCYNTAEFHQIYREMFQISAEEPMDVKVRFENLPFIRDKIERLCGIRKTAKMEIGEKEILFTDTIRGEGDFARYLRRFGRSAIVDAPESLRERMLYTSRKVIELYS